MDSYVKVADHPFSTRDSSMGRVLAGISRAICDFPHTIISCMGLGPRVGRLLVEAGPEGFLLRCGLALVIYLIVVFIVGDRRDCTLVLRAFLGCNSAHYLVVSLTAHHPQVMLRNYFQTESDDTVNIPREFTDQPVFGRKAKPKKYKGLKIKLNLKGRIFTEDETREHRLPYFSTTMVWEDMPYFINSMSNTVNLSRDPDMKLLYQDMKQNWNFPNGEISIAEFIKYTYSFDNNKVFITENFAAQEFPHHKYIFNPQFVLKSLDHRDMYGDNYFIRAFVAKHNKPSVQMNLRKIKSIIRNCLNMKLDDDNIIEVLKKHMVIDRENFDNHKHGWVLPFIPYDDLMYRSSSDDKELIPRFYIVMEDMKRQVVRFAQGFIEQSKLTPFERNQIYKRMRLKFINIMRTPAVQKLFVEGHSIDTIKQFVYENHYAELKDDNMNSHEIAAKREMRIKNFQVHKHFARSAKYFETESLVGYFFLFNFFFILFRYNYIIKLILLIWRTFVSSYFLGFRILTIPYRFYKGPHNLSEFVDIEWNSIIGNYMPDMMPAHVLHNLTFVLLGEVHPSDHMRVGTAFVNAAYVHYAQLQSCGLYPFVINTNEIFEPDLRVFIISQLYTKIMNRIDQDMFVYSEFINMIRYGTYIRPATRSVIALLVHDCLVSPRVLPYEYVYFKIAAAKLPVQDIRLISRCVFGKYITSLTTYNPNLIGKDMIGQTALFTPEQREFVDQQSKIPTTPFDVPLTFWEYVKSIFTYDKYQTRDHVTMRTGEGTLEYKIEEPDDVLPETRTRTLSDEPPIIDHLDSESDECDRERTYSIDETIINYDDMPDLEPVGVDDHTYEILKFQSRMREFFGSKSQRAVDFIIDNFDKAHDCAILDTHLYSWVEEITKLHTIFLYKNGVRYLYKTKKPLLFDITEDNAADIVGPWFQENDEELTIGRVLYNKVQLIPASKRFHFMKKNINELMDRYYSQHCPHSLKGSFIPESGKGQFRQPMVQEKETFQVFVGTRLTLVYNYKYTYHIIQLLLSILTYYRYNYTYGVASILSILLFHKKWEEIMKTTQEIISRLIAFGLHMYWSAVDFFSKDSNPTISDIVADWSLFIENPSSHKLNARHKIAMTNIFIIINATYDIIKGDQVSAARHLSYFFTTESDSIVRIVLALSTLVHFKKQSIIPEDKPKEYTFKADGRLFNETAPVVESFNDVFTSIASLLAGLNVMKMSDGEIRRANAIGSYINTTTRLSVNALNSLKFTISWLCRVFYSVDPFDREYQTYVTHLGNMLSTMDLYLKLRIDQFCLKETMEKCVKDYDKCVALMRDPLFTQGIPHYASRVFSDRFKDFEKLYQKANETLHGNRDRVEPPACLFNGPAGVGKSSACEFIKRLMTYIIYYDMSPEERERTQMSPTFNRTMEYIMPDSEYWEGYTGQLFATIDDMGQSEDTKDRKIEALKLIRMVNVAPMNCNMAFGEKGNRFFTSKVILVTSNMFPDGIGAGGNRPELGITSPAAFIRRFAIIVHRADKYTGTTPIEDLLWRVEACPLFPEFEGKLVTTAQIARIMVDARNLKAKINDSFKVSQERLQEIHQKVYQEDRLVPLTKAPPDFILKPEGLDESKYEPLEEDDIVTESAFETIFKFLKMGVYPWQESPYLYYIIGFGVILTTFITTAYLYQYFKQEPTKEDEDIILAEAKGYQRSLPGRKPRRPIPGRVNVPEGNNLSVDYQNSVSKIANSMTSICFETLDENLVVRMRKTGQAIHIKDGIFAVSAHVFAFLFDEMSIPKIRYRLRIRTKDIDVELVDPRIQRVASPDLDLYLVRFPDARLSLPPSLYKYFMSDEDTTDFVSGNPLFVTGRVGDLVEAIGVNVIEGDGPVAYDDEPYEFLLQKSIRYSPRTYAGMSGGAVVCRDKNDSVKIIGTHCCRSGVAGYSVGQYCSRTTIDKLIDQLNKPDIITEGLSDVVRQVPYNQASVFPRNTKIRRGLCHNYWFPAKTAPAALKPVGDKDPYDVACQKLSTQHWPSHTFNEPRLMAYLRKMYPDRSMARKYGVLSWDQCVSGVPDTKMIPICLGTSAGWPKNLSKTKGKFDHIKFENDKYVIDPNFLQELEQHDAKLKQGEQIDAVYARMLKDELRDLEKVEALKTRLFLAAPLHLIILFRKYFYAFFAYVQTLHLVAGCAVGINYHSWAWTLLYKRLRRHRGSVVAGDYKNWDGSAPKYLGEFLIDFINWWYDDGPINVRIRKLLFLHICEAFHIHGINIFQVFGGIPSGMFGTAEFNSILGVMMLFIVLVEDLGMSENEFDFITYGDDNVVVCDRPGVRVKHLAPHLYRRFGMTYTHFSKGEMDVDDTLETISFLQRKFVVDPVMKIVRAPLPLETILESVYWCRKPLTQREAVIATCENFAIELVHHGRAVFDKYTQELIECILERDKDALCYVLSRMKSFDQYQSSMYDSEDGIVVIPPQMFDRTQIVM